MSNPINTILFDLDGTLIDTEPVAAQATVECFKSWGLSIVPEDSHYITGRTWAVALEYLFSKYPIPVPPQEASAQMLETYRKNLKTGLIRVEGSAQAVQALAPHFQLGLVSGSHRSEIFWALDELGVKSHFEIILGAEDYPRSKPAADGYLKALSFFSADPQRTLVFEDSQAGIASALAAQTWVVAITGTNHFKQDSSGAHHHIPDLTQVTPLWVHELSKKLCGR